MTDGVNNPRDHSMRCTQCGKVDSPLKLGPGPGWLAIALWAASAALWTAGMLLGSTWIGYLSAAVFLGALLYTLWYFYRREVACRHCGSRHFEPEAPPTRP